jgi:hypothetical protein
MQLRRIVTEFPRIEPVAYAFTYADTATYEEEIDEWFTYSDADFLRLRNAQETFARRWKKFHSGSWVGSEKETLTAFIRREVTGLQATDLKRRCKSLQTLLHITLGVWDETASNIRGDDGEVLDKSKSRTLATASQIESIKAGVVLITEGGGVAQLYELMKRAFDRHWYIPKSIYQKCRYC